jgi:hypothetical protein
MKSKRLPKKGVEKGMVEMDVVIQQKIALQGKADEELDDNERELQQQFKGKTLPKDKEEWEDVGLFLDHFIENWMCCNPVDNHTPNMKEANKVLNVEDLKKKLVAEGQGVKPSQFMRKDISENSCNWLTEKMINNVVNNKDF